MSRPIDHAGLVAAIEAGDIVLIDAQAPGRFERAHLPGAHRLDWTDLEGSIRAMVRDRDAPVVVYCWNHACTGSEVAAAAMERIGYRDVRRYIGGKEDWVDHGGDLATSAD